MAGSVDEPADWQLCADWLGRCQVFSTEQMYHYSQSVDRLALVLKDGVLLCHLLNKFKPLVIEQKNFSQRPQMSQFLCLRNIRTFLQTLSKTFRLKDADLFAPEDLFDVKNFSQVIHCLSILSRTKEAQKVTQPFAETGEYYNLVPSLNDEIEYNVVDNSNEDEEEDVYGRLVDYATRLRPTVPAQTVPPSKRDLCIAELVDTEKNYINVLTLILEKFKKPLRCVLAAADIDVIFFKIEDLKVVHNDLYSELQKSRHCTVDSKTIAACFINFKLRLLSYGEYCSHLERANKLIAEICSLKPVVKELIDRIGADARVNLRDLLTIPVQRILKYHLLLKELIKHTGLEHPEYASLKQALEVMEDVSMYINEVKRDSENLDLISEIEKSIVNLKQYMPENTQLKDYGRRLSDGELKVKTPSDRTFSSRHLFLFDRVLLICQPRNDSFLYRDVLNLHQYEVNTENAASSRPDCHFVLTLRTDPNRRYIFQTTISDMQLKWTSLLNLAKDNIKPKGAQTSDHDFVMENFHEPTTCCSCHKLLRGVFYQGYRCTKTQMVVHKECIMKVTSPPAFGLANKGKVRAEKAYDGNPAPSRGQALTFAKGITLTLLNDSDLMWWEGKIDSGERGFFPKDRVRKILTGYEDVTLSPPVTPPRRGDPPVQPLASNTRAALPAPMPIPEPSTRSTQSRSSSFEENLSSYNWFAGDITREVAGEMLKDRPDGTFLIRFNEGKYALSVRYDDSTRLIVKHIRIYKSMDNGKYSFSNRQAQASFNKISELVDYYKENSLRESFEMVATKLITPYREGQKADTYVRMTTLEPGIVGYCVALYDFSANQPSQLSFSANDTISIISQTGRYHLWWKGRLNGQEGYFPSNYVAVT